MPARISTAFTPSEVSPEAPARTAASRAWARAAALDPSYVSPLVNSAVLEFEGDKESVAEQRLWNLVKAGRGTADVWFNLGVFQHNRKADSKAL